MGACCGGMKTSHQHKSLPEKNKAAAATAASEPQLNNDGVAAKTAAPGVEGDESQPLMSNGEDQLEVAATTTSLEASPPSPLKQNGSHPEVLHGNHVDADQQQPDVQHIEEPDLLVAVKAATVSAEVPTAIVEEPEVAISEKPVLAAATNVEEVASEPSITGDDAANEQIRIDSIQLRISEDGDLERPAAAEESPAKVENSVQESQVETETTTIEEAAPVVPERTSEETETVEKPTSQEEQAVVDVAVVEEETRPTVEDAVEAAVPYQPETTNIEEITADVTSPDLPAVPKADSATEESTDKTTEEVSAPTPDVQVEPSLVVPEVEQNVEVVAAASTLSEPEAPLDSSIPDVSTVNESVEPEPETVHVETPVDETTPELQAEPTTTALEEEVPTAPSDVVPEEPVASPSAILEEEHNVDVVITASSISEPDVTEVPSVPEVSAASESVDVKPASSDVAIVEEQQTTSPITNDITETVPSEQEPQLPANVDSEPPTQEEEHPVETAVTAEVVELVEATSPVEAKETEAEESVKPISEDSEVTAAPETEVDAVVNQALNEDLQQTPAGEVAEASPVTDDSTEPLPSEQAQPQSPIEEVVHTEAGLEATPEVPASESDVTSQSVPVSAEEVTVSVNEGETDQRLAELTSPEQPETITEETSAPVEVASEDNAQPAPVDEVEVPQPDVETTAHESQESNTQEDSVQSGESAAPEVAATADQTPVNAEDVTDQSLPPPPPADTEVVPATVETEQQPASPVVVDGDDFLPPPPPPEELSIDQQVTPAVDQQPEPALPAPVADDGNEATALADSGVSLTISSPDDSTVVSPTSDESTTAVNTLPSESGEIASSTTLPSSEETHVLSEA